MNLLLRLLALLLSHALSRRPARPLLATGVYRSRVWPTDLDLNLHMNNGRFLSLMDLGRVDLMLGMKLLGPILKRRWMPVVAASTIRYRRSLGPGQRFTLHSRLVGWDDRWTYLEQVFRTADDREVARALVKAAIRKPGGGTVAIPDLARLAGHDGTSPPLPAALQAWIAADAQLGTGDTALVRPDPEAVTGP